MLAPPSKIHRDVDKTLSEITSTISGVQSAVAVWYLLWFSYESQRNSEVLFICIHEDKSTYVCLIPIIYLWLYLLLFAT